MSTELREEFQKFVFDGTWTVFCYDCDDSGYHKIRDSVQGTKSCDLIGVRNKAGFLMEIKDFRGYRIQNKARISDGELTLEVAQKVKDTLAGIISGVRRNDTVRPWMKLVLENLCKPDGVIYIYLLLEDDAASNQMRWKQQLDTMTKELKQRLNWLQVKVLVTSPQTFPGFVPGLVVSNLPGATGYAGAKP